MDEGPHSKGANETAQPASKVVRLPRDWLGPHEELIPFGRHSMPPAVEDSGLGTSGPPPNAEDFWGERSAAVQVPASGAASDSGSAAPASRFGPGRRSLAAASVLAVAAAAVAVVVLSGGAVHRIAGGARLNLAAIFSSGVSRSLTIGPPRIVSATDAGKVRHTSRRAAVTKPVWHASRHHGNPPAPSPTYAARATPASVEPRYRSNVSVSRSGAGTSPTPTSPSRSSAASVSPTGESGALGPVQSPNG